MTRARAWSLQLQPPFLYGLGHVVCCLLDSEYSVCAPSAPGPRTGHVPTPSAAAMLQAPPLVAAREGQTSRAALGVGAD